MILVIPFREKTLKLFSIFTGFEPFGSPSIIGFKGGGYVRNAVLEAGREVPLQRDGYALRESAPPELMTYSTSMLVDKSAL